MEEIINKVLDIDQKALQKQRDTEQWIKENEKRLKKIYTEMEKEIIQEAKDTAQKKYEEEMKKCSILVKDINAQGDNEIRVLEEYFNKIHEDLSQSIFNEIFEIS